MQQALGIVDESVEYHKQMIMAQSEAQNELVSSAEHD
jgi:hypothetical protein